MKVQTPSPFNYPSSLVSLIDVEEQGKCTFLIVVAGGIIKNNVRSVNPYKKMLVGWFKYELLSGYSLDSCDSCREASCQKRWTCDTLLAAISEPTECHFRQQKQKINMASQRVH